MAKIIKLKDNVKDFGYDKHALDRPRFGIVDEEVYINTDLVISIRQVPTDKNGKVFKVKSEQFDRENVKEQYDVPYVTRVDLFNNIDYYTTESAKDFSNKCICEDYC